jgi:hypothetical protein
VNPVVVGEHGGRLAPILLSTKVDPAIVECPGLESSCIKDLFGIRAMF